ncbi:hypothetical protein U1Q18_046621 [Sarracenia purpurea var. burkii]
MDSRESSKAEQKKAKQNDNKYLYLASSRNRSGVRNISVFEVVGDCEGTQAPAVIPSKKRNGRLCPNGICVTGTNRWSREMNHHRFDA